MRQKYDLWNVVPDRATRVSIEGLFDDWEGFRLLLRDHDTDRMIRISFGWPIAYQKRDESDLVGEASRSDGLGRGCFYEVKNSESIKRFDDDSVRKFDSSRHFAVVTDSDCVDVICIDEPKVDHL